MDQKSIGEKPKVPVRLISLNKTSQDNVLSMSKDISKTAIPNTIRRYGNQES